MGDGDDRSPLHLFQRSGDLGIRSARESFCVSVIDVKLILQIHRLTRNPPKKSLHP
jgi:hypothetical protein